MDQIAAREADLTEASSEISEEIQLKQFYANKKDSEKLINASRARNFGHSASNRRSGFPNLPVYAYTMFRQLLNYNLTIILLFFSI